MKLKLLLMLSLLLALSGCGDLLHNKVIKKGLDTNRFNLTCKLDIDQFSLILHQDISSQIRCLGESLNLFIRAVESPRPGYMSRVGLEAYLKKNRPEITPEVIRALTAVFKLNNLITGDDPDFISKENVDKIINVALIFNHEAAKNFGPIFENQAPITYAHHRANKERVDTASKNIEMALSKIYVSERHGAVHYLNITDLLTSFTTNATEQTIAKIKKVLFLKKVLIGGDTDVLTHVELFRLIMSINQLAHIGLDGVQYKFLLLEQDSLLDLLRQDVNELFDMVFNNTTMGTREDEFFFTVDEAMDVVKTFVSSIDISQYKNLIVEFKKIFMGGNAKDVYGRDLRTLLSHGKTFLQKGTLFHRFYSRFKVVLASPQKVDVDFSQYAHDYPKMEEELKQFERIVKKYRFMKGEFLVPFYTSGYHRNPDAVVEIAFWEYVLGLVFKAYDGQAQPNDSVGGYSIDAAHVTAVVQKFKKELIAAKLILPHKAQSIADNISLLGTLFQFQSDKNGLLDVNEGTEFATTLLTSITMSKAMLKDFREMNCPMDHWDRVEPTCFRGNFFKLLCNKYRTYYPLLFDSLNTPASCENVPDDVANGAFLDVTIRAARTCNNFDDGAKEEIYYSEGDIMSMLVVMMHVETTILRWDSKDNGGNENNIMDPKEVDAAYEIYSPALDGFLADKPAIVKAFKKQIYQYMIKYEEVPDQKQFNSILKFIKFLLSFDKKASASRKTMASILVTIGKQNAILHPPDFQCDWLRNPDKIPAETEPMSVSPAFAEEADYSHLLNDVKRDDTDQENPKFYLEKELCITLFKQRICL